MNADQLKERLDVLAEVYSERDVIMGNKQKLIDSLIPDEIKKQIAEVELEFATQIDSAEESIKAFEEAIKAEVKNLGESVKGTYLQAVWSKPRVTWDNKGLDGFMVAHPEIKAFRKEGEPTVSIRFNKS